MPDLLAPVAAPDTSPGTGSPAQTATPAQAQWQGPPEAATASQAPHPTPAPERVDFSTPAETTSAAPAETVATPLPFADVLDIGIDWASCREIETVSSIADAMATPEGEITVSADAAVAELGPERLRFSGDVELTRGTVRLRADELTLDRTSRTVSATSGILLTEPNLRIAGDSANYALDARTGEITGARYRIPAIRARGDAERAALLGDGTSRYEGLRYTTCSPDRDDWLLEAEALELDHDEGLGTAKDAKLTFFGVPLLYVPTFTFPIDDRRRSGVLIPSIGYGGNTGADLRVPYYLNLAPNYDLTLVPRLMSKRGAMLGGEFRFLTGSTEGALAAELLPNDREYTAGDGLRGSASLKSRTWFNELTEARLRINYVSDSEYFEDLGDSLAVTSTTHLERTGEVTYHGDDWTLLGRAQYYQTVDDTLDRTDEPYARLPQLRVDLERPGGIGGLTYHLNSEYAYFYRRDSVRGHRVDLFPALSLPLTKTWGYLEPKIGTRYTAYRLSDEAPGANDGPSTLSGLFSVDGGLYFDRAADFFDRAATHTLEPRLYYLLVPNSDQDDQPIFDTAALDFGFDNLFRENRFAGADRFGDANQLTLALTSRVFTDNGGEELLRASLGQILYFDDRDVTLPGEATSDDASSAVIAEVDAALVGGWRSRAGLQWNPHDGGNGNIDQALAQIHYRDPTRNRYFNAAYRLRDGVVEQTDLAAIWPVDERLSLIARHNHSLREDRLLEALAGLEYGRCCWRLRAVVRRFTDGDGDENNLAFLLQLELNGLGRLGDDIDSTLERGIYGYRTENDY